MKPWLQLHEKLPTVLSHVPPLGHPFMKAARSHSSMSEAQTIDVRIRPLRFALVAVLRCQYVTMEAFEGGGESIPLT